MAYLRPFFIGVIKSVLRIYDVFYSYSIHQLKTLTERSLKKPAVFLEAEHSGQVMLLIGLFDKSNLSHNPLG